jgi:hypothetical protein
VHAPQRHLLVVVFILSMPALTQAQGPDRAIVLESAPILLLPDPNRPPLRVAAKGTSLIVVSDEGDWLQVQFQDPQFGLRTGYVRSQLVRVDRAAMRPLDLSVPAPPPAVAEVATAPQVLQPALQTRSPLVRRGFWFSAGLGYGSLSCDTCDGLYASGVSGGLAAGGTVTERFLLGAGTTGWYRSEDGAWLSASTFDVRTRFYPVRRSGFFINGGVGVGSVSLGTSRFATSETGLGLMFGLGWDIRTGNNISVTPFWNGSGIATESVTVGFGQIGLGFTLH